MLNSNEPIKVAHLPKLTNQSMLNGALVIGMVDKFLVQARKTLVVWESVERSNKKTEMWAMKYRFRLISKLFRDIKEQECY